jgi:aminopeptidase N
MPKKVRRLLEQFQPENYQLEIDLDRDTMTFGGRVIVHGRKTGIPSQRLTFHQKDLKVTAATIIKHDKKGDKELTVKRINSQNSLEEVRLHTEETIYPGDYTATVEFQGKITRPMHGIYPCFFKHGGKDKKLLMTQFESHHAREAFPCIDEPEAKATFDLTLSTPAGETALSNTPVMRQSTKNKRQSTAFETTPKMSTYLLAFATGEMHGVVGKTKDGIEIRSWATVAQPKEHLRYANNEAVKTLEFFSDYFQTPFPLKKLDQVAVPDFESLAMENWGLITYREVGLLADPKNRSLSGEQLISLVIAHEISHQWFGNLVTMKWWDDLWLNESFASIMENLAPDTLHPEWHQWEDFATSRVLSASQRDIYKDVQSVSVEVRHPDEIMTLFDPAIVYAKGARLLCMLRDYIGEEAFRKGLRSYFKKHAYGNTAREDLWQELGSASGQDINKIMTPWIKQSGQPQLSVSRQNDRLRLSQARFLLDGKDKDSLWPVPLLTDKPLDKDLMAKRTMEIPYSDKDMPIFNIEGSGHYIVCYEDEAARDKLKSGVARRSVDSIARINIINDMLLLIRAERYPMIELLDLLEECRQEPRAAVWMMFMRTFNQVQGLIEGDKTAEENLRAFKRHMSSHWYNKLGWVDKKNDDTNTRHLRTTALALSIAGEHQPAIDQALKMFENAGSVEELPADQRSMIASAAVRHGNPGVITRLMKEYVSSPNPEVQNAITVALCSTKKPAVAKRLIKWGLGKDGAVRPQDIGHWFAYLMRNYHTRELAWEWLTGGWSRLAKLFGGGKYMEYFIWYSSGPLSTPRWQARFRNFFEPKMSEAASKRNIRIAFSEIAARVTWRERNEADVKAWLKKYHPKS